MTLIAALEGQDGIVLASDSRGTIGDPRGLTAINDSHIKLFRLSDNCGIAVSGAAEISNKFIDEFKKVLEEKGLKDVDPIADEIFTWGRAKFQEWFGSRPFISQAQQQIVDQRPALVYIMAGYNKDGDEKARIYLFNSQLDFAPQLCEGGHMLAGVPQYAIYLLHRLYNRQMNLSSVQRLAAYLIQETATQDPKVGGPVRMAKITLESGYQELQHELIDKITKENEAQNAKLRNFFFKGGDHGRKNK